jgi:thioesterase domain-containing protein
MFKGRLIKHLWPAECTNMMPINTEGKKVPFILLHGERMNYPLSTFFGTERPFYGFFHYGSEGEKIFHKNVASFATDYISQLQRIVPEGPYYLAGFSFGGLIAFEMAVQLQKLGYEVPVLILIDCKNPMYDEPIITSGTVQQIAMQFYNFSKDVYYWIFHRCRSIFYELLLKFNIVLHNKNRNYYIMSTYIEISKGYKPQIPFKGEILLFKTKLNKSVHEYLGWDKLCTDITMVLVEGDHKTIYESKESYETLSKNIDEWMQNKADSQKLK